MATSLPSATWSTLTKSEHNTECITRVMRLTLLNCVGGFKSHSLHHKQAKTSGKLQGVATLKACDQKLRGQTEKSAPFILPNFLKKVKLAIDKPPKVCYNKGTKKER